VTTTIGEPRTGRDSIPAEYAKALSGLSGALTREAMAQRIDALAGRRREQ
jgi:hypothetical protein